MPILPGVFQVTSRSPVVTQLSNRCLVCLFVGSNHTADDLLAQRVHNLKKGDLTIESSMDSYRKSLFVLRSGVLKTPLELTSCSQKEPLRRSHASDVVMSVDGHHVGVDPESSQATSSEVTSSDPTSSEVTSSGSVACDVALSFAEADKRAAVILKQLLLEKVPSLKISEPMAGDFSRVQSLDCARVIVPLLSPAFLASSELIEELNIAIFRNRSSSRRILYPVQVSAYPPKPSYVHLIPCEFSSSDYRWAWKIVDQNLRDEISRLAERNFMDVDEAFNLKTAASVISERLLEESKPDLNLVNRVLLNVHEIEEDWTQVKKALQREEGLEAWKRTFEIEINSGEGDLKADKIIKRDILKSDVDTKPASGDQTESNGVELHLKDIRDNAQNAGVGSDIQALSEELTEHDRSIEGESKKVEKIVRFQDDSTIHSEEHDLCCGTPHSSNDGTKESKSCSLY